MSDLLVLDIGGTNVKFAAVAGGVHRELGRHVPTASLRIGDPVENLARLIEGVAAEMGFRPDAVVSTVPAFLDPDLDYVHSAGNIPELNGRRLATDLGARLGLPVYLERDSFLLLMGEWAAGAGRGADQLLGIFFGTGVGGAFLEDGRPFRGSGFALEIGSMPFKGLGRTLDGLRPDCLETYVSGRVLAAIAERHDTPIADVFALAAENPALKSEIDEFVRDMAMAVSTAITLLSPGTTVVGGGVCTMRAFPYDELRRSIEAIAPLTEIGTTLDLRRAELGWMAVSHGALQREREGRQPTVSRFAPARMRSGLNG